MRRHAARQDSAAATEFYRSIFVDSYPSVREAEVAHLAIRNSSASPVPYDAATASLVTDHESVMKTTNSLSAPYAG